MSGIEIVQVTSDAIWVAALVLGLMQALKQLGLSAEWMKAGSALILGQYFSVLQWAVASTSTPLVVEALFYAHIRGLVGSLAAMGVWALVLKQVVEWRQPYSESPPAE